MADAKFIKGRPSKAVITTMKAEKEKGKTVDEISKEMKWSPKVIEAAFAGKYDAGTRIAKASSPVSVPVSLDLEFVQLLREWVRAEVVKTLKSLA